MRARRSALGIAVVIQDERGNNISEMITDTEGVIGRSLPDIGDASYSCVRFIDPYGDAIFNPHQARIMIGEWERLKPVFIERSSEALWGDIRKLIVRCSEEPHTYLRFVGD